jgi:ABC-type Fe3+-hydroxamate transport system substrate-binding protein
MRKAIVLSTALLLLGAGCASMKGSAVVPSARTGMMASNITEAEYLGAKKCSPQALAKAIVALDQVNHEVQEGYYHPVWLEHDLANAEKVVAELLAERKAAASPAPRLHSGTGVLTGPGESCSRKGG